MSTEKGGSDLDVFNDLNPRTPDGEPMIDSKKTLLGLPSPRGGLPPVPGSRSAPPPPPSARGPASQPRRSSVPLPPPRSSPVASSRTTEDTPITPPGGKLLEESQRDDRPPSSPPAAAAARTTSGSNADKALPGAAGGSGLDTWLTAQPSSVLPPAPAAPAPSAVNAASLLSSGPATSTPSSTGEVGWDDDDDKTTIYDKDTQTAAQALLQPAYAAAAQPGRPPPPMSRPPGAMMPPTHGIVTRTTAPPVAPIPRDATFSIPPVAPMPAMNRLQWLGMALVVSVCVGVLVYLLLPKKGSLTVTVAGPANKPLEQVEIIVDGRVRCNQSPCRVTGLKEGAHMVQARAAGYQGTAETGVEVSGNQEAVHNVLLSRALPTGIRVFGEGSGLTLSVDGREIGPLPQVLREMEPGEHLIQVSGGEHFGTFEQRVAVEAEHMKVIGPVKLPVVKGLVTIVAGPGAAGADVILRAGNSRKTLPQLPVTLEIPTNEPHIVVARKRGYSVFQQEIGFAEGEAKKTIEISMVEEREAPVARPTPPFTTPPPANDTPPPPAPAPVEPASAVAPEAPAPAEAPVNPAADVAGMATLNLSSTPPSNVVLDGKPLGSTPHVGLPVPAGTHTVIFINGSERRRATVTVTAGSTKTVSVKFD
jgi:serine/threonine-protein kinase